MSKPKLSHFAFTVNNLKYKFRNPPHCYFLCPHLQCKYDDLGVRLPSLPILNRLKEIQQHSFALEAFTPFISILYLTVKLLIIFRNLSKDNIYIKIYIKIYKNIY